MGDKHYKNKDIVLSFFSNKGNFLKSQSNYVRSKD